MSITIRSNHVQQSRRGAGGSANRPPATVPIRIIGTTISGSTLMMSFDQAVILSGTPGFKTDLAGPKAISAQQASDSLIALTFDAPITGATMLDIGFRDPAIRNSSGGYVTGTSIAL
jgi:hypothetical protein